MNELQNIISEIDFLVNEIQKLGTPTNEQLERFFQKMRLEWNFHSNNIEGNSLTFGETKTLILYGITAKGKPLKDHLEIQGHDEAVKWILEIIKGEEVQRPISELFIRELHKLILKEPYYRPAQTPDGLPTTKKIEIGVYKTQPNHVKTSKGEMFYFATPEETPAKMDELIDWQRAEEEKKELHPILLAVGFHYRFVRIHPFDDGNGRMARLLMNFILMKYGFPPAVILTEHRKEYIEALREIDQNENLEPFAIYIAKSIKRALEIKKKALNNESLDEEGDFEKKIKLLKAQINPIERAEIKKSPEVVENLFLNELLPKIQEKIIDERVRKLGDLFMEIKLSFGANQTYNIPNFDSLNFFKTSNILPKILFENSRIFFAIDFDGFLDLSKKIKLNSINLIIEFEVLKYKIFNIHRNTSKTIEKPYHLSPSNEEWEEMGNFLGNSILEEIQKQLKS